MRFLETFSNVPAAREVDHMNSSLDTWVTDRQEEILASWFDANQANT